VVVSGLHGHVIDTLHVSDLPEGGATDRLRRWLEETHREQMDSL